MSYTIRPATMADWPQILTIFADAREFMRQSGNPNQWGEQRPAQDVLLDDISRQQLQLCTEGDEILAVFAYIQGIDPTYVQIYQGQWRNDAPYGVIHRIAVTRRGKNVAAFCFDWALRQCPNLRIDTHRDNAPMRRALEKAGFACCGIIHLADGDERIAYHKVIA